MIKVRLGDKVTNLSACGYSVIEEAELYDRQLKDIITNTRTYLDKLEELRVYSVSWKNFNSKTPTMPHRFVKHKDL